MPCVNVPKLTFPVGVVVNVTRPRRFSEAVEAKVRQLEDESGVDDAVGGLEVAVRVQVAVVNEMHALKN